MYYRNRTFRVNGWPGQCAFFCLSIARQRSSPGLAARALLAVLTIVLLTTGCVPHMAPHETQGALGGIHLPDDTIASHSPQPTSDMLAPPDDDDSQETDDTGGQHGEYDDLLEAEDIELPEPFVLPDGFVYVTDIIPDAVLDIRYHGNNNFLGVRVDGYLSPVAILTIEAAEALSRASDDLRQQGYFLLIFDAYRPQAAVDHFVRWVSDENDTLTKDIFYPGIDKSRLIPEGYIASRSGHSRGSTVDLSLVCMLTGEEVDMGTCFDFFGVESHHGTLLVTADQSAGRLILKDAMERAGFRAYTKEWWHYTLISEPYPDTFFTFYVSSAA